MVNDGGSFDPQDFFRLHGQHCCRRSPVTYEQLYQAFALRFASELLIMLAAIQDVVAKDGGTDEP